MGHIERFVYLYKQEYNGSQFATICKFHDRNRHNIMTLQNYQGVYVILNVLVAKSRDRFLYRPTMVG